MGEIKSSLDLVLEKTRHLKLSDEERRRQRRAHGSARIGGLLQQALDRKLTVGELGERYRRLKEEFELADDRILVEEALRRVDPGADNRILWSALASAAGLDASGLERELDAYRAETDAAAAERRAELKACWAETPGISGTAVAPNLEADPKWRDDSACRRADFAKRLRAAASALLGQ